MQGVQQFSWFSCVFHEYGTFCYEDSAKSGRSSHLLLTTIYSCSRLPGPPHQLADRCPAASHHLLSTADGLSCALTSRTTSNTSTSGCVFLASPLAGCAVARIRCSLRLARGAYTPSVVADAAKAHRIQRVGFAFEHLTHWTWRHIYLGQCETLLDDAWPVINVGATWLFVELGEHPQPQR